jgi:arylsulfatase A-like enzyme
MPHLTEHMMLLAEAVADSEDIGKDDVVDLMVVSVSGTDYVGHSLGAMSWELADQLIRADRAMGALIRKLEERGPVSVLITADHGVSPLPEKNKRGGTRLFPDAITQVAQAAAAGELGEGEWVADFASPFLYLKPGIEAAQRDKALPAIIEALSAIEGVHGAYDVREAKTWRDDPDRVKRSVALSIANDTPGALYLLPSEGCIVDEDRPRGKGTTHGTPWSHDSNVPAIFWGRGIQAKRIKEVLAQNRVAPTISKLLGIAPPKGVTASPLPGAK